MREDAVAAACSARARRGACRGHAREARWDDAAGCAFGVVVVSYVGDDAERSRRRVFVRSLRLGVIDDTLAMGATYVCRGLGLLPR